jgi:hypothetical protein
VPPIRIALLNLRPILRDIIEDAVIQEADMSLTGAMLQSEEELEDASADVLVVGTDEPDDGEVPTRLLWIAPRISVLMIAMSGGSAVLYELRPQKQPLGEVTVTALLDAIRWSAGNRVAGH